LFVRDFHFADNGRSKPLPYRIGYKLV